MISIIGGGPIGAYTAYLLARKGYKTNIFEEHNTIGKPVQCTGITTTYLSKLIKPNSDFLINKLNKVIVHSKNLSTEIKVKELVLNREKFDKTIVEMALSEGVKLNLSHKFKGFNKEHLIFHNNKKAKKELLIGADGPSSIVGKSIKSTNKNFYFGMQARIKNSLDPNTFEVYFGTEFPKFFGWVVPESDNICRVGIAAKSNTKHYFDLFLKKRFKKDKILSKQGGLIPIFNPKMNISTKNTFLVGDSAGMVKATTGGGLVPGLLGAKTLAESISNNKNYTQEFKKKVGNNLKLHLLIRNTLNNFSDKDYSSIIKLINRKSIKNLFNNADREFPLLFLTKLLFKEPRFLLFLKNL